VIASNAIIRFIKGWESCVLEPHWDALGGVWDIGYGHVLQPNDPHVAITQEEADSLFELDLKRFEEGVTELVTMELRQHEFDALVSFAYNVGLDIDQDDVAEGLGDSTLLRYVNKGEFARAACEFTKWTKASGRDVLGLYRRRCAEQAIFLLADYSRGVKS
jgi:lysozyme